MAGTVSEDGVVGEQRIAWLVDLFERCTLGKQEEREKCEKEEDVLVRIGVLAGSAVSAIMGFIILKAGISRLSTTSAESDEVMPENLEHHT